jgi:mannose-1-phosphate guanylyltransferase
MYAVIMAGGEGTRFWPVSRATCPKQFLSVLGGEPLIVQTLRRLEGLVPPERTLVMVNRKHQETVRRLVSGIPPQNIIVEPRIRDTAPCIGLAASLIRKRAGDQTIACLPSDHILHPDEGFRETLRHAENCVQDHPESLLTIGIQPAYPATGYGYILRGPKVKEIDDTAVYEVTSFYEKPSMAVAEAYFDSGDYFWNSGISLGRTDTILAAIRRRLPELHQGLETLGPDLDTEPMESALARVFPRLPRISFESGVLEQGEQVRVIEGKFAWDDMGTWRVLRGHLPPDEHGNVIQGNVVALDDSGCTLYSSSDHLVTALGVRDLIIVSTPDATLVTTRDNAERVRELVAKLKEHRLDKYL